MTDAPSWKPTEEALRALVDLLPRLAEPPETEWKGGAGADGVLQLPYLPHDDVEAEFVARAARGGWVDPFDWPAWQEQARLYVDEPARLATAPLGDLRKLITLHVRNERFTDGHIRAMRTNGHLAAIVRRLADFL